jgi:hypothetical protein
MTHSGHKRGTYLKSVGTGRVATSEQMYSALRYNFSILTQANTKHSTAAVAGMRTGTNTVLETQLQNGTSVCGPSRELEN